MKIAIIGGSGFVGTRLTKNLFEAGGFEVINIDKQKSSAFPDITTLANVLDKPALTTALAGVDLVVLLAAEHRDDITPTSLYYDVNVQGMRNTLDAMAHNGTKHIIFISSVAVYGLNKVNPNEDTPVEPFNDYGKSKWQAEQVLQQWYASHPDWKINIVRPTVIFGENNRGNVYNLLSQIASGRFLMIGKGNNKKSMSYIGNIVAFIEFLIKECKGNFEVYNYVDFPDFTTNDLVNHTSQVLGKKVPTVQIPYFLGLVGGYGFSILAWILRKKLPISPVRVKKFCAVTQYDASKVLRSGFVSPFSIQEGLKRTLIAEFRGA
jgi:nucleoside-diphosphate-sugar epimerase